MIKEKYMQFLINVYLWVFNLGFIISLFSYFTKIKMTFIVFPLVRFWAFIADIFGIVMSGFLFFILWGINQFLLYRKIDVFKNHSVFYYLSFYVWVVFTILAVFSFMFFCWLYQRYRN